MGQPMHNLKVAFYAAAFGYLSFRCSSQTKSMPLPPQICHQCQVAARPILRKGAVVSCRADFSESTVSMYKNIIIGNIIKRMSDMSTRKVNLYLIFNCLRDKLP